MRLRNIEFGIAKIGKGNVAPFQFAYDKCWCGCGIWSIGWFYFTILRGECLICNDETWEDE